MTYFRMGESTLSLAWDVFTTEFEKGSGGTRPLWSPSQKLVKVKLDCLLRMREERPPYSRQMQNKSITTQQGS